MSTGIAMAWGYNLKGQLAGGWSGEKIPFPEGVLNLEHIVQVSNGNNISFFLLSDGTVRSAGGNDHGQLGHGGGLSEAIYPFPVQVVGEGEVGFLTGVKALATGGSSTCAVMNDGTIRTWGGNLYGTLGNGNSGHHEKEEREEYEYNKAIEEKYSPAEAKELAKEYAKGGKEFGSSSPITPVGGLTGVLAAAAGHQVAMVLKSDGSIWRWGQPSNEGEKVVPTHIQSALTGVTAIACSYSHALALHSDGTVTAWGNNQYGELGNGERGTTAKLEEGTREPYTVLGLPEKVIAIACSGYNSYFLLESHKLMSCGRGNVGQLGNGESGQIVWEEETQSGTLKSGSALITGLTEAKKDLAVGMIVTGLAGLPAGVEIKKIENETEVLLTAPATKTETGSMKFTEWGDAYQDEPVYVQKIGGGGHLENVVEIDAGTGGVIIVDFLSYCLARKSDNTLAAWGYNQESALGDGTEVNQLVPAKVLGISDAIGIAAGEDHSLALIGTGTLPTATAALTPGLGTLTTHVFVPPLAEAPPGGWRLEYRRVERNRSKGTFTGVITKGSKEVTGVSSGAWALLVENQTNLSSTSPGLPAKEEVKKVEESKKAFQMHLAATASGTITFSARNNQQESWHGPVTLPKTTLTHTFTGLPEPASWAKKGPQLYEVAISTPNVEGGTYGRRIAEAFPLVEGESEVEATESLGITDTASRLKKALRAVAEALHIADAGSEKPQRAAADVLHITDASSVVFHKGEGVIRNPTFADIEPVDTFCVPSVLLANCVITLESAGTVPSALAAGTGPQAATSAVIDPQGTTCQLATLVADTEELEASGTEALD